MDELWSRLKRFFNNLDSGMTKERYLEVQRQLGKEPREDKIPPDEFDFPPIVGTALDIYQKLGDRVVAEVGYLGKDFTNLQLLLDLYQIEEESLDLVLDVIFWIDNRNIKKSSEALKRERDKLKAKARGKSGK